MNTKPHLTHRADSEPSRLNRALRSVGIILALAGVTNSHAVTPPYIEDFEGQAACNEDCGSVCPLADGWSNEPGDDHDWIADFGGTPSGSTGPGVDALPGTDTGMYLYLEASSPCTAGDVAQLDSPALELTGTALPTLQFEYHMLGDDMGVLHIDILDESGNLLVSDAAPPLQDNVDSWQTASVDLTPYLSQGTIRVRFRGEIGDGFLGDMAIDAVNFFDADTDADMIFADRFESEGATQGSSVDSSR